MSQPKDPQTLWKDRATATSKTDALSDTFMLSVADQKRVARLLLTPPKPNAALCRAFQRHSKLIAPFDGCVNSRKA